MKALTIIRKYPAPVVFRLKNVLRKDDEIENIIKQKMEQITKPQKVKQADPKDIKFCPIWIRKFF